MTTDTDYDYRIDDHTSIKIDDNACIIILHRSGAEMMIRGFSSYQQAYDCVLSSQFGANEYRIHLLNT